MPRSTKEIIEQADELSKRFQDHVPGATNVRTADTLRQVRQAFFDRPEAEKNLTAAVEAAGTYDQSWAAIGAMLGTSGEAASQRYGMPAVKR
jgi:3-mercaptopyruvate sulfurtransferase SseA